jgi:hypothetical protein
MILYISITAEYEYLFSPICYYWSGKKKSLSEIGKLFIKILYLFRVDNKFQKWWYSNSF